MNERPVAHEFGGEEMESVLIYPDGAPYPAVLMFPTVAGIADLERGFAHRLADRGLSVMIADFYGKQYRDCPREQAFQLMGSLRNDRARMRRLLQSILDVARDQPEVVSDRIIASGYCFGGMCSLDLARSGADILGAASFHGLFDPPELPAQPIKAKVIAFHGWDDPSVPPEKVVALAKELTEAGADWQINAYGHTAHAFTNPGADAFNNPAVKYSPTADRRSWTAFNNFLDEILKPNG
jgi:dienelactone hydrolase